MVLLYIPSSFVCPKEEARKGHPTVPSACGGCLALLAVGGTLKTHRLRRLKQVQRLIPPTTALLSGTERVYKPIFSIFQ